MLHAAAGLLLLAALIYLLVTPERFEEWWGYGTFLAAALAQALYAPLLLRRPGRRILRVGAAGNLAVVILWSAARTTRIPFFGPHAGEVEEIGAPDIARTLAEVGILTGLGTLAIRNLPTEWRRQIAVVTAASSLLFWHLLDGSAAHIRGPGHGLSTGEFAVLSRSRPLPRPSAASRTAAGRRGRSC